MGTLDVIVDASTMFTDDDSVNQFDPARLSAGMTFVEIRAHLNESGVHVAGVFHVEDEADEYQIEGPLDPNGFVPGVSISVSGVAFNIDPNVIMEDGPPMDGDIVDVEDFDRDGDADSIDVED